MRKTSEEAEALLAQTSQAVSQHKLKSTEGCVRSTQEAKELFSDFVNAKLGALKETKRSYQASRTALARLDSNLEAIDRQLKSVYDPAAMDSFARDMDAALESKLARL